MIIQCEQCKTKFKLDDSKVTEAGVKVRCSKCKHVFLAKKETAPEEPDFDSILGGLGETPAASASKSEETQAAGTMAAPEEDKSSSFAFEEEPPGLPSGEEVAGFTPETTEEGGKVYDFSSFGLGEEPANREEEETTTTAESFAAGSFEQEEKPAEPATFTSGEGFEPPDESEFDFGEAAFAPEENLAEPPVAESFEIEDFGTPEEGAAPAGESFAMAGLEVEAKPFSVSGEGEIMPPEAELDFGEVPIAGETAETSAGLEPLPETFVFEAEEEPAHADASAATPVVDEFTFEEDVTPSFPPTDDFTAAEQPQQAPPLAADMEAEATVEEKAPFAAATIEPPMDEELPPLSISSRRRGPSIIPIAITAISVAIVVFLAAFGLYFLKLGPEALNRVGLGSVARMLGINSETGGAIKVRNISGAFLTNKDAGEIFIIRGEAVNNFKQPRAGIQVKGTIYGPKGAILQKSAYCGNALSPEDLTSLPLAKIEAAMNNQFGASLSNLGVKPGKSIPFVIVFTKAPKESSEFGVEAAGSTVATQ